MPSTPIYGLPYPAVNDQPNGPSQVQALAQAVEDELVRVDTAATVVPALPRGIIGGRVITGLNALGPAIGAAETMPTNMNSGTVNLEANRRYKIHARYKMQGTVATDAWVMRIREGANPGTAGNQLRQDVRDTVNVNFGFTWEFDAEYETGGAAVSKVFSFTAVRVGGTGTVTFLGGDTGSTNLVGVWVEDVGPAGLVASVAS